MYFWLWIVTIGITGGWFAGKLMTGRAYGRVMDVFMGLGGAVAIGMWADPLGGLGLWGFVYSSVSALLGAMLLTGLTAFMNGRRYA
jgi:uncharacterized membrane protein YeaQ/YmgE (transglycosylase-associated protein family)